MRIGWLCSVLIAASSCFAQPLAGTRALTRQGDLAMDMVASIDRYLMQRLHSSSQTRVAPIERDREDLAKLVGVVDPRITFPAPVLDADFDRGARVGGTAAYDVLAIRWPVLDGVDGEGLMLVPKAAPAAYVVALPDADWTPEALVGLSGGVARASQFARRLAENGCLVIVPTLINRSDEHSGSARTRFTNMPHREFIHRGAYELGRHLIGYEAQKVMAAVDWFRNRNPELPIGVIGYGEGGLIAQMSAALDKRIDAVLVSGYFQPREHVWREPIYRNIWSQLIRFGDAEIAALIAPRHLIVEASPHPPVSGPPVERQGRRGAASGSIETPGFATVRSEVERAKRYPGVSIQLVQGNPGSDAGLGLLLGALKVSRGLAPEGPPPEHTAPRDTSARQYRQFRQLIDHTQKILRASEFRRAEFMAKLNAKTPEALASTVAPYRKFFWEEIQGKMPAATEPLDRVESRLIYDKPAFRGYEVVIPVWGDVFAYGILLLPKDLRPGERRPVVVCQHGLEGRPQFLIDPPDERNGAIYAKFAAALAERGFIVFAPQNPYIGTETFRVLMRKGNPVKLSLFSFIIGQHDRILDWLVTLPQVDASRIGFYGLSYGGKTAMRLPPLLDRYALSICSGDFNEWIAKISNYDYPFTYVYTQEYDMLEFGMGETFNYFEMAAMIAPRPFMVERGHKDGVGIDEWVSAEYAKVRRFYAQLGLSHLTEIEYFDGPHQIHAVGTYRFLHKHLHWPEQR